MIKEKRKNLKKPVLCLERIEKFIKILNNLLPIYKFLRELLDNVS